MSHALEIHLGLNGGRNKGTFSEFVNKIHDLSIPLTIISAGLGDVIDSVLQNAKLKTEGIEIVALTNIVTISLTDLFSQNTNSR
ncbi:unnamed protein product [Trichobilharzia regenti]|nr:unnamed protein product [Trichobilharzia regenti]